jgi:NAD(P)-dependent dehydrogenase (short-subunit alcohol dehydrogenase family)
MSVRNLLDLGGKTAIVTGGSRGIGLQMALALGEMGARVALTARKQDELDESRAELEGAGIECHTVASDLSRFDTIPGVVSSVLDRWGQVDVLVNNAGCNWAAPAEDYPDEGWRKVMSLNIDACFFLCREVGKRTMLPRRSGKIINIASIAGKIGEPTASAYSAAKFGVIGFTRSLAFEVAPHNILVNAICPGPIPTTLGKQGWTEGAAIEGVGLDRVMARVNSRSPLGRLGTVESVARMALFIASDDCDFTTGAAFNVDGGIVMT